MTLRFTRHSILLVSIILAKVFNSCNTFERESLNIATAANVQFAMDTIVEIFENETGIKTNVILGSSGKLTAQIIQGAPYDIFVSANMKYPEEIYAENKALTKPEVYAYGALVLWTLKESVDPAPSLLVADNVRRIAIANPKTAPYGTVAIEFLKSKGWYDILLPKLVYGESIAQVNQFITTQTADIGFTAKSVVLSSEMKKFGRWKEVDINGYSPIEQGIILIDLVKGHNEDADQFRSFLLSKRAKEILLKFDLIICPG